MSSKQWLLLLYNCISKRILSNRMPEKKAFNSEFYERRIKKQVVQQIPEIPVVVNKSTSASHYMKRLYLANHSVSCLNNSTPAIKFTCNDSNKEINFLDDKKRLSRMGKTQETKISTNKTNIRLWTEFEVCFFFFPSLKDLKSLQPKHQSYKENIPQTAVLKIQEKHNELALFPLCDSLRHPLHIIPQARPITRNTPILQSKL